MPRNIIAHIALFITLLLPYGLCALQPVIMTDEFGDYHIKGSEFEILEDRSNELTLDDLLNHRHKQPFVRFSEYSDANNTFNRSSSYWVRLKLRNEAKKVKKWLFQIPLHTRHVEFYLRNNGHFNDPIITGQNHAFHSRQYGIRAIVFDLPYNPKQEMEIYMRIQSKSHLSFDFIIAHQEPYTEVLVIGYYILGITYGVLFLMMVYNFILFLSVREKVYLYYIFYLLAAVLFLSWKDGLGFQLYWQDSPGFNIHHHSVSLFFLTSTFILYSVNFLEIRTGSKKVYYALLSLYAFCILRFILNLFDPHNFEPFPNAYFLTFMLLYGYSIYLLFFKKVKSVRYFAIGFTTLFIGLIIIKLRYYGLMPWSWATEYWMDGSFVIESITLSLSIGDKLKLLQKDKENAQTELIAELKRSELLKDKVNRELEQKVNERTVELNSTIDELNESNAQLQYAKSELEKLNIKLDLDNWKLSKKIKKERQLRAENKVMTFERFQEIFPDQTSCLKLLRRQKWGPDDQEYRCRKCDNTNSCDGGPKHSRKCTRCNNVETAASNTLFHGVKFPLNKAFYMTYIYSRGKNGMEIKELAKILDLRQNTCYQFRAKVLKRLEENKKNPESWEDLIC